MNGTVFGGLLVLAGLLAAPAAAATLDDVIARGVLRCGINAGSATVVPADAAGWVAFDVGFCRALAAATLGNPDAVELVAAKGDAGLLKLAEAEIDVLIRDSSWTFSRDSELPIDFPAISFYDGQGFLVPKSLGLTTAKELVDQDVCVVENSSSYQTLTDYLRANGLALAPHPVADQAAAVAAYQAGECEVFSAKRSELAALRASFEAPADHVILPDSVSKDPLGPVVREGDSNWSDVVRWTIFALISAEELGVTSANVDEMAKVPTTNAELNRLLGTASALGPMLGLQRDWAHMAIRAGGNYGEIFARSVGEATPVGLPRGLNALWKDGGLLYAPPFR